MTIYGFCDDGKTSTHVYGILPWSRLTPSSTASLPVTALALPEFSCSQSLLNRTRVWDSARLHRASLHGFLSSITLYPCTHDHFCPIAVRRRLVLDTHTIVLLAPVSTALWGVKFFEKSLRLASQSSVDLLLLLDDPWSLVYEGITACRCKDQHSFELLHGDSRSRSGMACLPTEMVRSFVLWH